ncbi:hypothetical protein HDU93_005995 [Gonapodya sp. JEL0774]|nr:hypothetical protein HDU93_005995 [Gonapodya sp. JEL0774]
MANGDAMSYLQKSTSAEDRQLKALTLLYGLACAMECLHDMDVVHADLKVLVDKHGECRLTDFGFAKVPEDTPSKERPYTYWLGEAARRALLADIQDSVYEGVRVDTSWYMSPSRLGRMQTVKEDDVYSYEISLYEGYLKACKHSWRSAVTKTQQYDQHLNGLRSESKSFSTLEVLLTKNDGVSSRKENGRDSVTDLQTSLLSTLSHEEIAHALQPSKIPKTPDGTVDVDQALLLYQHTAELGFADAQERLAFFYRYGLGYVIRDLPKAAHWYRQAAEQNHARAQRDLGSFYLEAAQYNLAIAHGAGIGVGQDLRAGAKWYLRAAEKGDRAFQYEIGNCYASGDGVEQSDSLAFTWHLQAAEQGHLAAQYAVGKAYYFGTKVEMDLTTAAEWWRQAAEQGDPASQFNFSSMLSNAMQGFVKAQCNLAMAFEQGRGIAEDKKRAVYYYEKAAGQRDAGAQYK